MEMRRARDGQQDNSDYDGKPTEIFLSPPFTDSFLFQVTMPPASPSSRTWILRTCWTRSCRKTCETKRTRSEKRNCKTVLEERGRNHFEVLPEGWVQIVHNCGIPVYLQINRTRVCCVARPYFLGPGSVRRHEVPLSSIPCLSLQKALEAEAELEQKQKELQEKRAQEAEEGNL